MITVRRMRCGGFFYPLLPTTYKTTKLALTTDQSINPPFRHTVIRNVSVSPFIYRIIFIFTRLRAMFRKHCAVFLVKQAITFQFNRWRQGKYHFIFFILPLEPETSQHFGIGVRAYFNDSLFHPKVKILRLHLPIFPLISLLKQTIFCFIHYVH